MDNVPLDKMQEIPEPQKALGWQFSPRESRMQKVGEARSYVAVYTRRYTPEIDDLRFIEHRGILREGHVWVLTNTAIFTNWDEAHQDAIETMVEIDMHRKPREIPEGSA